jgi:MarR family transcriptional regulator, 2-MHQ and catechol-resistance regulon repressor
MGSDLDTALGDERLTVMGLFAETWASLTARANAHLAGFGVSGAEFEVCLRLARSPEGLLRMTDLAAQTALTSSGITRVVDRLVERGLVTRRSCATDRRTTYAVISETGRDLLARVLPGHLALAQEWVIDPLSRSDAGLEDFVAGLRALRDHGAPCATAGSDGAALSVPEARPEAAAG